VSEAGCSGERYSSKERKTESGCSGERSCSKERGEAWTELSESVCRAERSSSKDRVEDVKVGIGRWWGAAQ
jgi:hypothetical protein